MKDGINRDCDIVLSVSSFDDSTRVWKENVNVNYGYKNEDAFIGKMMDSIRGMCNELSSCGKKFFFSRTLNPDMKHLCNHEPHASQFITIRPS